LVNVAVSQYYAMKKPTFAVEQFIIGIRYVHKDKIREDLLLQFEPLKILQVRV
jgi:hypothetical protein